MAVTTVQLAAAMRLGDGVSEPSEPILGVITRLLSVAQSTVQLHASTAPDDIQDEAIIRLSGYLYDQPSSAPGQRFTNAYVNSGAASLLGPWTKHRTALAVLEE